MKTLQIVLRCVMVSLFVTILSGLNYLAVAQQDANTVVSPKIEIKQVEAQKALVIKVQIPSKDIGAKMGELYGKLFTYVGTNRIATSGAPFAVYYEYNPQGNTTFEVGVPVSSLIQGSEEITYKEFPAMKVASSLFIGPYDQTGPIYEALMKYIKDNNLQINGASWEIYLNDPMQVKDPSKYQTLIYFPIN